MVEQQNDTALSFWELFNTRMTAKELKIVDTGQNDSPPFNQSKMLGGIGPDLHLRKLSLSPA